MIRKIIKIDEKKCNGCGLCVSACHEGAISIVNGKAMLIKDEYCDGLGDCLPKCPTDAIQIIERHAKPYDEIAVKERMERIKDKDNEVYNKSELKQWPVQIKLVNERASYFNNADLLIAADCTAYAYRNFHKDFMKDKVTIIGCPKLDDNQYYQKKLTSILLNNNIRSINVIRMEVPCCRGLINSIKNAILQSNSILSYNETIIGIDGILIGK